MRFQLRFVSATFSKPSSLFDINGKRAFFNPLSSHPLLPMARVDDRTKARRQRFVEKYIEVFEKNEVGGTDGETKTANMLRKVMDRLIKEWALDVTTLQIKASEEFIIYFTKFVITFRIYHLN